MYLSKFTGEKKNSNNFFKLVIFQEDFLLHSNSMENDHIFSKQVLKQKNPTLRTAQSAGAAEYTECISAEG